MNKGYVVCEVGWEYNDENYYRGESGGGTPKLIFTDLEKANKYCEEQNQKEYRRIFKEKYYSVLDFTGQYEGIDELFTEEGAKLFYSFECSNINDFHHLTEEQYEKLVPHFTIPFYEVCEVDVME